MQSRADEAQVLRRRLERERAARKQAEALLEEKSRELYQVNEEARQAREAAEAATHTQSRFLASMSHEIRTPMNAVLGFGQLLQRAPLSATQRGHVDTIVRNGEYLLDFINDVLELSKVEAGHIALHPKVFSLHAMLKELEALFRIRTDAKGLRFEVELLDGVPPYINTDAGKLRRILMNMLSNALRYTEEGGVVLRVGVTDLDGDAQRLVAEVQDTGSGIAADDLSKIFTQFEQTQSGLNMGAGTGLGVPLSRAYARLLGGDLTVRSEVSRGSVFHLEVGFTEAKASDLPEPEPTRRVARVQPGQSVRVLVVDNKADNRTLLTALLADAAFEVRDAANGMEALDVVEAWSPAVVMMDMRMPVMDGYEATRRIKAGPRGPTTKVIAVTASVFDQDAEKVFDARADELLWKPFKANQVFEKIAQVTGVEYEYEDGTGEQAAHDPAVTRTSLASLPADLVAEMRASTIAADMDRLDELIDVVESTDAKLAQHLRGMANRYEYQRLAELLPQKTPDSG